MEAWCMMETAQDISLVTGVTGEYTVVLNGNKIHMEQWNNLKIPGLKLHRCSYE